MMTAAATPVNDLGFTVPLDRAANAPPATGVTPDTTRMLAADVTTGEITHHTLRDLPHVLRPEDVLVVNTSKVLPAAVPARHIGTGEPLRIHWSTAVPGTRPTPRGSRFEGIVEVRRPSRAASQPFHDARPGDQFELPINGRATLMEPVSPEGRLWVASLSMPGGRDSYLSRVGEPIRYGDGAVRYPLSATQTVFAKDLGSAEPPSASLGFDGNLVSVLRRRGIAVLPVTLHTGVASLESHEPPYAEWYSVPRDTVEEIRRATVSGGRVIAAGTTVTRALESAAVGGQLTPGRGWTDLVIGPSHPLHVVDGLISGWHEPEASHLHMLEAVAGRQVLVDSYTEAIATGYLWHAFGDVHLLTIPPR